ncbi:MAG TPA: hypothetical protein VGE73_05020 [Pseudolabrys sp.]|jgi:hypothetical protein
MSRQPKDRPEKAPQRPQPEITPDSVPDRPEILPDDMRRRDRPEAPDSLPPAREEATLAPDGGNANHPVHDEPIEDMEPQDYEAMIDNAEEGQIRRQTDDEIYDPRANRSFSRGSGDPLDQRSRDSELTRDK